VAKQSQQGSVLSTFSLADLTYRTAAVQRPVDTGSENLEGGETERKTGARNRRSVRYLDDSASADFPTTVRSKYLHVQRNAQIGRWCELLLQRQESKTLESLERRLPSLFAQSTENL
jgi:hypothetical protein